MYRKYLVAFLLLVSASCSFHLLANSTQPNVLWIYAEDMNAWMGTYGDKTVSTPNIDMLAENGVRFDNAIMPSPVCSATRSAIITGSMPTTLGVHNHRSGRNDRSAINLPKDYLTIPELFRQAGYQTFNTGKDDYNFSYDREQLYSINPITPRIKKIYSNPRNIVKFGGEFSLKELDKSQPFFGQIQLKAGKHKGKAINKVDLNSMVDKLPPYYPAHKTFLKAWARHYEQIEITDREIGEILNELRQADLLENTIVLFFSDHGMVLPRHKQFLYEGGLKVPFVGQWFGNEKGLKVAGSVRQDIINGIDIGTSSLALAGIKVPSYMEGDNIFADDYKEKSYTFATRDRCDYTFDRIRAVRSDRYKYIRNFHPERAYLQSEYRSIKSEWFPFMPAYKALHEQGKLTKEQALFMADTRPKEELYDLQTDPHEINNLATHPGYQHILMEHRSKLEQWIIETNDQGQYPESTGNIADVIERWGDHCTDIQCQNYRQKTH